MVDDADIKVSIDCHGERSGNRSGCHDEDMWRVDVFSPEFGSLFDSESVLFVDDDESEVMELYGVFDECVCPDEYIDISVE